MGKYTGFNVFLRHAIKYGFSLFGTVPTGDTTTLDTGDDGYYQKGYPRTGARFTDNGDGTITDNGSGLMWPKDANGAGCAAGAAMPYGAAISYAEGSSFAGHSDWRMPNIKEIMTILNYDTAAPAMFSAFENFQSAYYWSSTYYQGGPDWSICLGFTVGKITQKAKAVAHRIVPVRGGFRFGGT